MSRINDRIKQFQRLNCSSPPLNARFRPVNWLKRRGTSWTVTWHRVTFYCTAGSKEGNLKNLADLRSELISLRWSDYFIFLFFSLEVICVQWIVPSRLILFIWVPIIPWTWIFTQLSLSKYFMSSTFLSKTWDMKGIIVKQYFLLLLVASL